MGQQALAVVYGVPLDGALFDALREDPTDKYSDLDELYHGFETGSESDCLGVSVGTSIYAEDGEREMPSMVPVADLERYLAKQIKAAEKKWQKMAAATLKKKKLTLPRPQLLLVTVERA